MQLILIIRNQIKELEGTEGLCPNHTKNFKNNT